MNKPLRIGFIGLNPDGHWAATAHLPALNSLTDKYALVGVANSTPESAHRTAEALGLPHAFANAVALHEVIDAIEQSARESG